MKVLSATYTYIVDIRVFEFFYYCKFNGITLKMNGLIHMTEVIFQRMRISSWSTVLLVTQTILASLTTVDHLTLICKVSVLSCIWIAVVERCSKCSRHCANSKILTC